MLLIKMFLACFLLAGGGALLLRRRFEQALPLAFLMIILVMYGAGWCGSIMLGFWLVWALVVAAAVGGGWVLWRRREAWHDLCTPGAVLFAIMFVAVWVAQTGRRPSEWDDLSHWALVVKNMWFYGGFGNAAGTTTLFRDYPPALSLLQFFFVQSNGAFREDLIYIAYSLFLLALQWPIFARVEWKRAWLSLPLLAVVLLLPLVFSSTAYTGGYAEPVLGVLFIYLLSTYWTEKPGAVTTGSLGAGFAVLALTKLSGIGLAALAWFCLAICRRGWQRAGRFSWRRALAQLAPLAVAGVAYGSWRGYCRGLGIAVTSAGASWGAVIDILAGRAPAYRYATIARFAQEIVRGRAYGASVPVSLLAVLLVLAGLGGLWALTGERSERRSRLGTTAALGGACLLYAGSLLTTYMFAFSEEEAVRIAAMDRYMGAVLLGATGFLVYRLIRDRLGRPNWREATLALALCLAVFGPLVHWTGLREGLLDAPGNVAETHERLEPFEVARLTLQDTPQAKVYFWTHERRGYGNLQARYVMTPSEVTMNWKTSLAPAAAADWAKLLREERYTHVWVFDDVWADPEVAAAYAPFLADPAERSPYALYRVEDQAGQVRLKRLDFIGLN